MMTYDELAERVLVRRNEYFKKQRKARRIAGTAVGCLVLAAAVWAGARLPRAASVTRDPQVYSGVEPGEPSLPAIDGAPVKPAAQTDPTVAPPSVVITGYGSGGGEACYAAPKNGDVNLSIPLRDALETYGDEAQYVIYPDFFRDGDPKSASDPEVLELIERLRNHGYTCEYSAANPAIVTLTLTGQELRSFTAPDGWGLMFFLRDERVG